MSKTPKTLGDALAKHDPMTIIANLQAELSEAKSHAATAETLREWIGSAQLSLNELQLPRWVSEPKSAGAPGVPTLQLSDLHWGERVDPKQIGGVNEYSLATARRRLTTVVSGAVKLARILSPEMRYPGIVVQCLGDMISGNIHEELQATNEINTMPTVLDLYRNLVPAMRLLADTFGHVFVPCVTGNHGRDTRKIWAKDRHHTSFDWLLYQFLAIAFEGDSRVTFYIPDGSDGMYRVFGIRYLITHGDQFRAGDSIIGPVGPITRGEQKKLARNVAVGQEYDVMCFGHWHKRMIASRLRGNGALKGYDEYAAQNNFGFEPPLQNFWITHADHGITFDAPLLAEEKERTTKTEWVSVPA
jgi:predicted phosphodiesterase